MTAPNRPAMLDEIVALAHRLQDAPAPRAEPFKFTPDQWAGVRLLFGLRTQVGSGPLGGHTHISGVPVVLVDRAEESTPVVEGWFKPQPSRPRRWWQRLWRWRP